MNTEDRNELILWHLNEVSQLSKDMIIQHQFRMMGRLKELIKIMEDSNDSYRRENGKENL